MKQVVGKEERNRPGDWNVSGRDDVRREGPSRGVGPGGNGQHVEAREGFSPLGSSAVKVLLRGLSHAVLD